MVVVVVVVDGLEAEGRDVEVARSTRPVRGACVVWWDDPGLCIAANAEAAIAASTATPANARRADPKRFVGRLGRRRTAVVVSTCSGAPRSSLSRWARGAQVGGGFSAAAAGPMVGRWATVGRDE